MIAEIIQNRGGGHVHLTPQETQALWRLASRLGRLTQALGRAFWHMTPLGQGLTIGVPSAAGMWWLKRWDPLADNARKALKK